MVACEILLKAYFISWSLVSLLAPLIKIKKKEEHKSSIILRTALLQTFFRSMQVQPVVWRYIMTVEQVCI